MSSVRIPGPLQALAEGMKEVEVQGATVDAVLAELVRHYPHLRRHLFDDGGVLRGYVNLYLNDEDVRFLDGLGTPLSADDVITIVPSVAGGELLPEITVAELKQRLDQGAPLTLVDVREPFEWEIANLGEYGARLMPLGDFVEAAQTLNPSDEIVVYCHSGGRSAAAVTYLREAGFGRVWNLKGGIHAWSVAIDPEMPMY